MQHGEAGALQEQGGGQMRDRAAAARRIGDLARPRRHVSDELAERAHRQPVVDREREVVGTDHGDGREVGHRIVRRLGHRRQDAELGQRRHQKRVAVGRGTHHRLGADCAVGARAVVDQHVLVEARAQPLGAQPRDRVGVAAGGEAHDDADRPLRPPLRRRVERQKQVGH